MVWAEKIACETMNFIIMALVVDQKHFSIRRKAMLSVFLLVMLSSILPQLEIVSQRRGK